MQNSILNKINVSTRILILIFCSIILLIAKSIYLIGFMMVLLIILMILTNKSVKFYIKAIEKSFPYLLFVFIAYIMLGRNIIGSFFLLLKLVIIVLYIEQFMLIINFQKLTIGFKKIFSSFNFINSNKISYDIVLFIYFINYYILSKKEIFKNYKGYKKIIYLFSLKHNIIPRFFFSFSKLKKLESSLKIKCFNIKEEEKNKISDAVLAIFAVFFVIVFFKEVIL